MKRLNITIFTMDFSKKEKKCTKAFLSFDVHMKKSRVFHTNRLVVKITFTQRQKIQIFHP